MCIYIFVYVQTSVFALVAVGALRGAVPLAQPLRPRGAEPVRAARPPPPSAGSRPRRGPEALVGSGPRGQGRGSWGFVSAPAASLTQGSISDSCENSEDKFPLPSLILPMFTDTSLCGNYTFSLQMEKVMRGNISWLVY